mmetsp:Transcript_27054/g.62218  ORF Transcript_27054/g.62218 Transcript_27054/m.62218 type:complete len:222 (-) Transcript_27054:866-1531(-)
MLSRFLNIRRKMDFYDEIKVNIEKKKFHHMERVAEKIMKPLPFMISSPRCFSIKQIIDKNPMKMLESKCSTFRELSYGVSAFQSRDDNGTSRDETDNEIYLHKNKRNQTDDDIPIISSAKPETSNCVQDGDTCLRKNMQLFLKRNRSYPFINKNMCSNCNRTCIQFTDIKRNIMGVKKKEGNDCKIDKKGIFSTSLLSFQNKDSKFFILRNRDNNFSVLEG